MGPSLKRFNAIQRTARFHLLPIALQFSAVHGGPFSNESKRGARLHGARRHPPFKVELSLLTLILCVEMRRLMLPVEHTHDDAEEHGDDGHGRSITPLPRSVARAAPRRASASGLLQG